MIALLAIRTAGTDIPVGSLSGGNQQKVVIAKWLMNKPRIILLNDPTRGIDVGTKQEIYALLRKLADQGAAILFYSTDYDELIGCCDRVLVLYDGAVKRELEGRRDHRKGADRQRPQHGHRGGRNERGRSTLNEWRFWLAEQRGALTGGRDLRRDVHDLLLQPSRRLHAERRADRRQQGRAARLRRHGAIAGRHDGGHRPLGRHGVHADQLPRLGARVRLAASGRRWASSPCSPSGSLCGAINGLIVIYGRLQPIVATIATSAVFFGIALWIRPTPGGKVDEDISDALTGKLFDLVPAKPRRARRRRRCDLDSL